MNIKPTQSKIAVILTFLLAFGLAGCSSTGSSSDKAESNEAAEAEAKEAQEAQSELASIPDDSPMKQVELGMSDTRVRNILGNPDDSTSYQTGKAWIPFYYGTDTHRVDWLYFGKGRVVFSINRYSGQHKVIRVSYEPDLK
ncbi:hypothetical protein [Alteromonas flava]|uniref:hypothetical protein n=1 Tax=Alteromonas flava TaxID=2048003 RepID=UPI000C2876FD|nr:hypothetical protein [Alteromonas flava]